MSIMICSTCDRQPDTDFQDFDYSTMQCEQCISKGVEPVEFHPEYKS